MLPSSPHPGQEQPRSSARRSMCRESPSNCGSDSLLVGGVCLGALLDSRSCAEENTHPLHAICRPEEVGTVSMFVANEGACYITGQAVVVDRDNATEAYKDADQFRRKYGRI